MHFDTSSLAQIYPHALIIHNFGCDWYFLCNEKYYLGIYKTEYDEKFRFSKSFWLADF